MAETTSSTSLISAEASLEMEEAAVWTAILEVKEVALQEALDAKRSLLGRMLKRGNGLGFHVLLHDPLYNQAHAHLNRLGVEPINLQEYDKQALIREGQ